MSDEAEKAWSEWVGNHEDVRATHRLAFDAGVESQQQRIRDLDALVESQARQITTGAEGTKDILRGWDKTLDQLAARDAVIERVSEELRPGRLGHIRAILNAAPESTLAEHDARVLEEAADRTVSKWVHEWLIDLAAEYRKGAGQ